MKIYLDVLVTANLILTFLYLKILFKAAHITTTSFRTALGTAIGGLSSLIIVIRPEGFGESLIITTAKLALIMLTVFAAVKCSSFLQLFRYFIIMLVINVSFGGICMMIWEIFGPDVIELQNHTVYFNVPLWLLIICVVITYALITAYDRIVSFRASRSASYKAVYTYGDMSIMLPAVCDTGNMLIDSFTGEPVMIFSSDRLYSYFELDNESSYVLAGFHLIPCTTVNGCSLMPVTLKGRIAVFDENGTRKDLNCAVGIVKSFGKERAIFNPKILI